MGDEAQTGMDLPSRLRGCSLYARLNGCEPLYEDMLRKLEEQGLPKREVGDREAVMREILRGTVIPLAHPSETP